MAGHRYTFAMVGTGNGGATPLPDTYFDLGLPNAGGFNSLTSSDDGFGNFQSALRFTADRTGTYYVAARAFSSTDTGQYSLSVADSGRALLDLQMTIGLIDRTSPNSQWTAAVGTPGNVTIGFRQTTNSVTNFSQFTAAQRTATQQITAMISEVCGLTFTYVNGSGYTDAATILLNNMNLSTSNFGSTTGPTTANTAANLPAGDVNLDLAVTGVSSSSLPAGSLSYYGLMHELGIAVGLVPWEGTNLASTNYGSLFAAENSAQYSVMSSIDETLTTNGTSFGNPDGLMLYDIAALQRIYGANNTTRNTATTYGNNSNAGGIYDFSTNSQPAFSIWDGGGVDTLDSSGYGGNQIFSLVAGGFSSLRGFSDNVSIAYGVAIENATSGDGTDRFILSSDNVNNTIIGGLGTDTAFVTYNFGVGYAFSLGGTAANFTMQGTAGADNFQGIEAIRFADGVSMSTQDLFGTYASVTHELTAFGQGAVGGGWASNTTYLREVADVNGDGKADIIGFASAGVLVSLATGGGHFGGVSSEIAAFGSGPEGGGWSNNNTYLRRVADVNGDGKSDIIGFGSAGVYVSLATGGGHFGGVTFELAAFGSGVEGGGWNNNDVYLREMADVNGDGMADIVGFGSNGVFVSLATGGGHFGGVTSELAAFGSGAPGGGWFSNDYYTRRLADVNGDGKADIVAFSSGGVQVSLATGGGHFGGVTNELAAFGPAAGGWTSDNLLPRELGDVNGDGMADIVAFASTGVQISLATGGGHFASLTNDLVAFGSGAGAGGWTSETLYARELGDVNGDGRADIVGFASTGVQISLA